MLLLIEVLHVILMRYRISIRLMLEHVVFGSSTFCIPTTFAVAEFYLSQKVLLELVDSAPVKWVYRMTFFLLIVNFVVLNFFNLTFITVR